MNMKHTAYLATEAPAERELLARLLEWQTTEFSRQFCPAVRSSAPDSSHQASSTAFGDMPGRSRGPAMLSRLNTVVAYEDVAAAKKAKEMWDRLRGRIGGGLAFEIHLWRFDVLRTPGLNVTAVKDAV